MTKRRMAEEATKPYSKEGLPWRKMQDVYLLGFDAAIDSVLEIVEAEPEMPGEMPEDMYRALQGDKDACAEILRVIVRLTKRNILDQIQKLKGDE